jgi:hypothetical protein
LALDLTFGPLLLALGFLVMISSKRRPCEIFGGKRLRAKGPEQLGFNLF